MKIDLSYEKTEGSKMATGLKDIERLEAFLDDLPKEPTRKIADKMLWTVWTRLHPEEAATKSEMGMKIETIKLLTRPDMDLDKFEATVEDMKKKLIKTIKEKKLKQLKEMEEKLESKKEPIKMELVEEPVEVEVLEVEPLEEELSEEDVEEIEIGERKIVVKKLTKKMVKKPVVVKKRRPKSQKRVETASADTEEDEKKEMKNETPILKEVDEETVRKGKKMRKSAPSKKVKTGNEPVRKGKKGVKLTKKSTPGAAGKKPISAQKKPISAQKKARKKGRKIIPKK